jgi:hypothetical protein
MVTLQVGEAELPLDAENPVASRGLPIPANKKGLTEPLVRDGERHQARCLGSIFIVYHVNVVSVRIWNLARAASGLVLKRRGDRSEHFPFLGT